LGFARAAVGDSIEDVELPVLAGGTAHLLSDSTANVFIFFKPGQEHSRATLRELAQMQREMAGKSIYWTGIVSDSISEEDVREEVRLAGTTMPVLIDQGDSLHGELGVALQPVIGLVDRDHKLVAYLPFAKIDYAVAIRARIRHLLREITDDDLQSALSPPRANLGSTAAAARRRLILAERLFRSGNSAEAMKSVRVSIEEDSTLAAAHLLLGRILAAAGRCPEAVLAFDRALALDDTLVVAREESEKCK
jgi:tetratricopeptide (TPR) repeat protein